MRKLTAKNPAHNIKCGTYPQNPIACPQTFWAPRAWVPTQFAPLCSLFNSKDNPNNEDLKNEDVNENEDDTKNDDNLKMIMTLKRKTTSKMRMVQEMKTTKKEDNHKNEDDIKKEPQKEENLKMMMTSKWRRPQE